MPTCLNCEREIVKKSQKVANRCCFCNRQCSSEYKKREWRTENPYRFHNLSTSTVGAMHELLVAYDLMKKGNHVFRALSNTAPCDLAIVDNGVLKTVEVRTGFKNKSGKLIYQKIGNADIWAIVIGDEITYIGN